MIVHRFMSALEYHKLMKGEMLANHSRHNGYKTDSVGFCFFAEPPNEAIHWLSGCVDTDYCVTMDIPSYMLTKSKGCYRDPSRHNLSDPYTSNSMFMERAEWCCCRYSNKEVRVLNATPEFAIYSEIRKELIKLGIIT